jgi:hypothetical protein
MELALRCIKFHGRGPVTSHKASTEDQIKLPRLGNVYFKNTNLVLQKFLYSKFSVQEMTNKLCGKIYNVQFLYFQILYVILINWENMSILYVWKSTCKLWAWAVVSRSFIRFLYTMLQKVTLILSSGCVLIVDVKAYNFGNILYIIIQTMKIVQCIGQLYVFVRVAENIGSNTTCVGRIKNKYRIFT